MSNCGRPIEKQTQETWHEICACLLATQACNSCSDQASLKPVLWPISQCNCQVAPVSLSLLFFSLPGFLWNNPKTRKTRGLGSEENSECQRMQKLTLDHSNDCSDPLSCLTFCWSFHSNRCWWRWWQILPIAGRQLYREALLDDVLVLAIFWDGWDRVPCATARIIFVNHIRLDWLHGSIVGL